MDDAHKLARAGVTHLSPSWKQDGWAAALTKRFFVDALYGRWAQVLLSQGRDRDALTALRHGVELAPEATPLGHRFIEICRKRGELPLAQELAAQMLARPDAPGWAYGFKCEELHGLGKLAEAERVAREWVARRSSPRAAGLALGHALRAQNRCEEAIRTLRPLAAPDQEDAAVLTMLAASLTQCGDSNFAEARDLLVRATAFPLEIEPHIRLVQLLHATDRRAARDMLAKCRTAFPDAPAVAKLEADLLEAEGQLQDALKKRRELVAGGGAKLDWAHRELASSLRKLGMSKDADREDELARSLSERWATGNR